MKNGCHLAKNIIFILFVIYLSGRTNTKWEGEEGRGEGIKGEGRNDYLKQLPHRKLEKYEMKMFFILQKKPKILNANRYIQECFDLNQDLSRLTRLWTWPHVQHQLSVLRSFRCSLLHTHFGENQKMYPAHVFSQEGELKKKTHCFHYIYSHTSVCVWSLRWRLLGERGAAGRRNLFVPQTWKALCWWTTNMSSCLSAVFVCVCV